MIADNPTALADQAQALSLLAKANPPAWECSHLESISKNRYVQLKSFLSRRHSSHQGVVAFKDVDRFISSRGNTRVDWRSLLKTCRRGNMEQAHFWHADYWKDPSRKEGVAFVVLDRNLLISRGLYKAALARYVLHYSDSDTLYGVKVSRWSVDWEMYETFMKLRRICRQHYPYFRLVPERKKVSESRQGHWVVDDYLLKIRRQNTDDGGLKIICAQEARDWLTELQRMGDAPMRGKRAELKQVPQAAA